MDIPKKKIKKKKKDADNIGRGGVRILPLRKNFSSIILVNRSRNFCLSKFKKKFKKNSKKIVIIFFWWNKETNAKFIDPTTYLLPSLSCP